VSRKTARPNRKYSEDYLQWGFYYIESDTQQQPVCVICNEVLSNQCMKPSLLQRHFITKQKDHNRKPLSFFVRSKDEFLKQQTVFRKTSVPDKYLQASYVLSLLAAKQNKPHTVVEKLVLPSAIEVVSIMFDDKIASVLKSISCSDNTVQRRIKDISEDLIQQVVEKIIAAKEFSMQLDESTDISGEAQLVVFVRVPDSENIIEHILLCRPLPERTTGEEIFKHIDDFFREHDILWLWCISICSDGAAAMTGRTTGFIARARQQNNSIVSSHCILHRHALASKRMSEILHETLNDAVKIINYIKSHSLNARLFRQLCQEISSDHKTLLFHTEVRWLSRGKVLMRIFELLCRLGYLADVFKKLNKLNVSLHNERCRRYKGNTESYYQPSEEAPFGILTEFWSQVRKEHDELGAKAITALLPFGWTYLCEKAFSSMTSIKTKPRNCLYLEYDLVVSVSTLSPRIQELMAKKVHISH
uniref:DUF4371 domain-containing protein n=1 Tax=Erpetoichthys calabaricus TaxID=27687 RepID=A0A8C4TID3_ERPCA